MRTDVLKQIEDILRPLVEGLQAVEEEVRFGRDGFKDHLLWMEEEAIRLMRDGGLMVRKVHRRPRKYMSRTYDFISVDRYAVRVKGEYFHPMDFLLCPDLYMTRRRGILPTFSFCERLVRAAPGSLSFNTGAKTDGLLSAKTFWKLFQLAMAAIQTPTPRVQTNTGYLILALDGFWLNMRGQSRRARRQKEEIKYCAIKAPGIKGICLYTSQDSERGGSSFQDGLAEFLRERFGDLNQIKGIVLGDGASWIKEFRDFYFPNFRFQLDHFHLKRDLRACVDDETADILWGKIVAPSATRDEFREELARVMRDMDDGPRKEKLLNWAMSVRRNWEHIRSFLFAEPPLRVLGSGMVEGIGGVMKQRLGGRRSWSRKGLENITIALKMFQGWV